MIKNEEELLTQVYSKGVSTESVTIESFVREKEIS